MLREVDVQVISNKECKKASNKECKKAEGGNNSYESWIDKPILCTLTLEKDACQGDSDRPLIIKVRENISKLLISRLTISSLNQFLLLRN